MRSKTRNENIRLVNINEDIHQEEEEEEEEEDGQVA
jgi:hypothetical protein